MYEQIVEHIISESKKVNRKQLNKHVVHKFETTAKKLYDKFDISPPTKTEPIIDNSNKKTPITKPTGNNRFPTKRVSFDDNVPWL